MHWRKRRGSVTWRGRWPTQRLSRRVSRCGGAKNAPEVRGLPNVPPVTSAPAILVAALEDIADVWERINDLHDQAAALVKSYGAVAHALLPDGHPLLKTIPTLTGG